MVLPGTWATIQVRRGDYTVTPFAFFDADENPINLAQAFDAAVMEIRKSKNPNSTLIKRLELGAGLTIVDVNGLNADLTIDVPEGKYYADIRFQIADTLNWATYLTGEIIVTNNISRV